MKLKYYLRGLGIGIITTSLIFIIAIHVKGSDIMTDAQVKARAKELGMVEVKEDTDSSGNKTLAEMDETKKEDTAKQEDTSDKAQETTTQKEDTSKQETTTKKDTTAKKDTIEKKKDTSTSKNYVEVTVAPGDYSKDVAKKLQDAGLIKSADKFNTYITDKNYDNLLQPGTFKIEKGATYKEIIKILTTKQEKK